VSNSVGKGTATYLATALDAPSYAALMAQELEAAGVAARALGPDVEIVVRVNGTDRFTFAINHSMGEVSFDASGIELVAGERVDGTVSVPAGAVRVVQESIG
jgi:beta-galactosidase